MTTYSPLKADRKWNKDVSVEQNAALLVCRQTALYFAAKRMLDLFFVLLALPLLMPFFLVIALLIMLDSPGSPIYVQERFGSRRVKLGDTFHWQPYKFKIFKFRTMVSNASNQIHQEFMQAYIDGDAQKMQSLHNVPTPQEGSKFKLNGDSRVTRVGHLLRKSSLDELPQIINVLMGDMSLVGPRPAIPYEVEMYRLPHYQRFRAKQGITGLWQVRGRSSLSFEEMVELDVEYVETQSIWLDFKILLSTIPALFVRQDTE